MKPERGWCITCLWNKGPCLPGGTLDARVRCLCSNEDHILLLTSEGFGEEIDNDLNNHIAKNYGKDGSAPLYRWEIIMSLSGNDTTPRCPHWKFGEGIYKMYEARARRGCSIASTRRLK